MDVDVHHVVKTLKAYGRHKHVVALLANKCNQRVVFSGGMFHHVDATTQCYQSLQGLLPVLKRAFWPVTDMSKILKTPNATGVTKKKKGKKSKLATRRNEKETTKKKKKSPNAGKGRFFGSIQGSQVHHELEDYILLDNKNFTKKYGDQLHPWTRRILQYIIQQGWYPIQCEFKVGNLALRVGTAIDMICVDTKTGHLVFIEIKTGYATYFENSDGTRMRRCLNFMRNSPLNKASVQLMAGVVMLLDQNPTLKLEHSSSHVLRIDEDNLCAYAIDNAFISRMRPTLMQSMRGATTVAQK